MDSIRFVIDDVEVECQRGETVLAAARKSGIYIPSLCYHPDLPVAAGYKPATAVFRGPVQITGDSQEHFPGCGVCLVQIDGSADLFKACDTEAKEGMKVVSRNDAITKARQDNMLALIEKSRGKSLGPVEGGKEDKVSRPRDTRGTESSLGSGTTEFEKVAAYIGARDGLSRSISSILSRFENDPLFRRDYGRCIGCLRCVRACNDLRGVGALGFVNKGGEIVVGAMDSTLADSGCCFCTACVEVCPSGAIADKDLKANASAGADELVPCRHACPAGIDVPEYVRCVAEGKYDTALAVIGEMVPFPNSLGYVCFRPCESFCRRGKVNEPIAICNLKRFAAAHGNEKWVLRERMILKKIAKGNTTGKTVAIVGAGPAGLAAAYFLALKGHSVTVFDKDPDAGGMMRYAIPEYRLPRTVLEADLIYMWQLGVKFKGNQRVSMRELMGRYDAIVIASGNPVSRKLRIGGMELSGVLWGLDFLRSIRKGEKVALEGKVVVIGGGHVAVNVALCAKRLGAEEVSMVCLEKLEEMAAYKWELDQAIEEGVKVHTSWGPRIVRGDNEQNGSDIFGDSGYTLTGKKIVRAASGKVKGVEFMRCVSVYDANEQFSPQYDDCEIQCFDADTVIIAIGQVPDAAFIDVEGITTERGFVKVEETCATTLKGVFACGEAVKAPGSVVDAIAQGRAAASGADLYLGGDGSVYFDLHEKKAPKPEIGRREGFSGEKQEVMPMLSVELRKDFSVVELGYGEEEAKREAARCLQCDLRLAITPVVLPPADSSGTDRG